ncbi:PLP-dependent aminotransferase family protein [Actibacterium sp. 188UL27-1]|uniref:MocR-like pyridoxine biosynthesis transcription factor PdxR n=1 Tax=Actibacterium sp. 188UL27-1 TaxID=2786961 RepID=UPI001EF52560|nr:PLP-dependent aminotransferase family protein [Actibacterium sp. 188UL27-1]
MARITEDMFFLDTRFQGTLQNQIQQMVAEGILSGRFRPGEKLPSTRGLARHLGVSRITVTLAYTELQANDYITSSGRSGYFISAGAPQPPRFQPAPAATSSVDWDTALTQHFDSTAALKKPADWRSYKYPFIYGQADPTLFDYKTWRLCALQSLGQREFDSLTGDHADRDDDTLVSFITRHILPRRGIIAAPDEVLITLGAQNGLWLAAQLLLNRDRRVVIEQPCYPGLRDILAHAGAHVVPVTVDRDGLPPDALPGGTDVVFVTPSHQCPTNATMPQLRRAALLERATRDNFLIIEDDYEFELSFLRAPHPALKSLDRDGRVIYAGSFSKSLFPGLRLGYLVGPQPFIQQARALRAAVLRHPPGHIQRTAAQFLSLGHYDALVRRMGRAFEDRRTQMGSAIDACELTLAGAGVFGGSSFWMRAPDHVDTAQLAHSLRPKGVLIEPGAPFFSDTNRASRYYRLAYSSIPANRIAAGIGLIADTLKTG